MDTQNTTPGEEQVIVSSSPNPLASRQNILLLVAALLVTIGFFLPWLSAGGGSRSSDYDDYYEFSMPTINGTFLLSNVTKVPEVGWLLAIFLLLVPAGGLIVAYNSAQRSFSEKVMNFGIAAAIFIPLSLFTFYLVMPKGAIWGEVGTRLKLGIGFIMMAVGGAYCLVYAIGRISQHMKNVSAGRLFLFGGIGGIITGIITYLAMDGIRNPGTSMVYLYLFMVVGGLLLSVYIHNTGERVNYQSGLVTGFIFSAAYVFTLLIIASIKNSEGTTRIGEAMLFLLVFHLLFGYVFSSLIATNEDSTGVADTFEFETPAEDQPRPSNPELPQ